MTIPAQVASSEIQLVPVFVAEIGGIAAHVCKATALHAFLEVATKFADWIKDRIAKFEFQEGQDFILFSENSEIKGRGGDRRSKDYLLCLDMAKELSMVENNQKGREARRYFINMERKALEAAGQMVPALPPKTSKTKVLPGGLTADQQAIIKELVLARAETLPQEQQAKAIITCWSALKSKFGCTYKAIPSAQFTDAVSLVARLPLGNAQLPVAQPGNPTQRWVLHFVNGVPRLDNAQGSYVLPASHFPSAIIGDEFPVDLLPSLIENAAKRLKKAE